MYNVAVILNESETQRYGWANVLPTLKNCVDHREYVFHPYTGANIDDFFYKSNVYDSIFMSTNACNDELLYSKLIKKKELFSSFLQSGKGLFVSFQKRLADHKSTTGFLPDEYEYKILGRNESSSEGTIEIAQHSNGNVLLTFPHRISIAEVLHRCRNNNFKEHLYRGLIAPTNPYNFTSIFIDSSYGDKRQVLLISRSDFRSRIVISTMSLDWEAQVNLLSNIITYITEGEPLVAFVRKRNVRMLDYEYLISSVKFHKIPSRTYDVDHFDDPLIPIDIHKFYVFGTGWTAEDCTNFWKKASKKGQNNRVYLFNKVNGIPTLIQCSNYSFSDSIIQESLTWLNSKFKNGRWQSSFWITHDVLEMMIALGISTESTKDEVLIRAKEHDKDGSYDGLMGSTCALFEIYFWLKGKRSAEYKKTLKWINSNIHKASEYDQQTAIITLAKLGERVDKEIVRHIYDRISNVPHPVKLDTPELDICRNCQICLLTESKSILDWIKVLKELQNSDGKWTNAARTATTITFLISNREKFTGVTGDIDQMIYNGISFLSSEYYKSGTCWYDDSLTTSKAVQAFKMFQRLLEYPVEETFLNIKEQYRVISNAQSSAFANLAIERIRTELVTAREDIKKQSRVIGRYKKKMTRYNVLRGIVIFTFITTAALATYLIKENLLSAVFMFLQDIRYVIPSVIVFLIYIVLTIVFERIAKKRIYADDEKQQNQT